MYESFPNSPLTITIIHFLCTIIYIYSEVCELCVICNCFSRIKKPELTYHNDCRYTLCSLERRRVISSLAKRTLYHQKKHGHRINLNNSDLPSLYGMSYNNGQYTLSEKTQTESVALISYSEFKYYETR